jgi:hypothetical protein
MQIKQYNNLKYKMSSFNTPIEIDILRDISNAFDTMNENENENQHITQLENRIVNTNQSQRGNHRCSYCHSHDHVVSNCQHPFLINNIIDLILFSRSENAHIPSLLYNKLNIMSVLTLRAVSSRLFESRLTKLNKEDIIMCILSYLKQFSEFIDTFEYIKNLVDSYIETSFYSFSYTKKKYDLLLRSIKKAEDKGQIDYFQMLERERQIDFENSQNTLSIQDVERISMEEYHRRLVILEEEKKEEMLHKNIHFYANLIKNVNDNECKECNICFDENDNTNFVELDCKHSFCVDCTKNILHQKCPNCRSDTKSYKIKSMDMIEYCQSIKQRFSYST